MPSTGLFEVIGLLAGGGGAAVVITKWMNRGVDKANVNKIEGHLAVELIDASRSLIGDYTQEFDKIKQQMASLEHEQTLLKRKYNDLQLEYDQLEAKNRTLSKRVTILEEENADLIRENKKLKRDRDG